MSKLLATLGLLLALAAPASAASGSSRIVLKNDAVLRELEFDGHVWRTVRFARADGSDELKVVSDEFHVLFLDDAELTLTQFEADGQPLQETKDGVQRIVIRYKPRKPGPVSALTITYSLGRDAYPRKTVQLTMREGGAIDRLEVERFSVAVPAERGGRGEPVFVGNTWWFGVEYPAFYSRHTDGNTPKWQAGPYDRMASFPSVIWLDGRDIEKQPRPGLIRLMHFPGSARKLADGSWGIVSKTAVCGVREPGLSMELSLLDYLATISKPVRSFIHYNNWFDGEGKNLSIGNFVRHTFVPMRDALAPYGVKIDAMVPDNGWQNRASIYEPAKGPFPHGWSDLSKLARALEQDGTHLGIWFALNGYTLNMGWGIEHGYKEASRNANFRKYERYFALSDPKFNAAVRESLAHLLKDCGLNYFKHDFNDMCDTQPIGQPQTDRHGHEAEVDATLELLAYERELNPAVYQNMTNWIWFSPWWLQHCDTIWMLAGDDGLHEGFPMLSTLAKASLYRDVHLYKAWGLGADRPLIPISDLMTHGIIYTQSLYGGGQDSIRDFADYVMMYYVRGLKLKEWYFTPRIMNADQWRAVGTITRWATENQGTLANAVLVGADPASGQPYGYMSWNGDHGILALRNPRLEAAQIYVPFDQTVWYRGAKENSFYANAIYPYQAAWPGTFHPGKPLKITVAGDSLLVLDLGPKALSAPETLLPPVSWQDGRLRVPDEAMQRCELLLIDGAALNVDGQPVQPLRTSRGNGWQMTSFDLRPWRGKEVRIAVPSDDAIFGAPDGVTGWLVLDRPVADGPASTDPRLPWAIAQGFRRQTVKLFSGSPESQAAHRKLTDDEWKHIRAAKLRIETFGLETSAGGKCQIKLGDSILEGDVPSNRHGDNWETQTFDLPADELSLLRPSNTLRIVRERDGDKFKFRGLALAVQLSDGTWVASTQDRAVQTSHRDWAWFEGEPFANPRESRPITLRFD